MNNFNKQKTKNVIVMVNLINDVYRKNKWTQG